MRTLSLAITMMLLACPISPGVANALTSPGTQVSTAQTTPDNPDDDAPSVGLFGEDGPRLYEEDLHALVGDHGPCGSPIVLTWTADADDGQRLCPKDHPGEIFRPPWRRS